MFELNLGFCNPDEAVYLFYLIMYSTFYGQLSGYIPFW